MAAATGAMRAHPAAATAKAPSRRATRGWVVTVLDEAAGRAAVGVDRSTLRASHGGALIQFDAPDAPGTPKRAVGAAGCVWRQLGAAAAAAPQLKAGGGGGAGGAYGAAGEQPAAVGAATRAPAGPLSATGGQSAARRGGGGGGGYAASGAQGAYCCRGGGRGALHAGRRTRRGRHHHPLWTCARPPVGPLRADEHCGAGERLVERATPRETAVCLSGDWGGGRHGVVVSVTGFASQVQRLDHAAMTCCCLSFCFGSPHSVTRAAHK